MSVHNQGCMPLGIISLISSYCRGPISEGDAKRQSEVSSFSSSSSSSLSEIAVPKILQMETVFQEMRLLQGFEVAEWRSDVALQPCINKLFKNFKELILELGPYPMTQLISCSQYGEMIHYVGRLNPRAVNDYQDSKPINVACGNRNLPALDALIRLELDPTKRGAMATELLSRIYPETNDTPKIYEELLSILISHGGDLNQSDLLRKASVDGHFSLIETCLKMGANPNLGGSLNSLVDGWVRARGRTFGTRQWVDSGNTPETFQKCAELLLRHHADIYSLKSFPSSEEGDCYNFFKFAMDLKKEEQVKLVFFAAESASLENEEILKLVMACPDMDYRVTGGSKNRPLMDYIPSGHYNGPEGSQREDVENAILARMKLSSIESWKKTLDETSSPLL